jgi:short subunit dehydrogenase-like uncharacterized protein
MTGQILLYGATGYTGKLIARTANDLAQPLILAGRNKAKLQALADPLGVPWRAFDLADPAALDAGLEDVAVVLLAAGPFSATARPVSEACLRRRVHYLDITGEIDVFEALAARDAEANQAGVMLLPGVGFDVVPSDCLAAHLKRRLPDAVDLTLFMKAIANVSRGTARTAMQQIPAGTRVRRGGRIVTISRPGAGSCDFGQGPRPTVQIPWGDVSTAFYSTGIPNIDVQSEDVLPLKVATRLPGVVKSLLATPLMQHALGLLIDRQPEGPTDHARQSGGCTIVGEARNAGSLRVRTRLRTPEPYSLTARTALDIAVRVASGAFKPGFQTPSLVFGPDYVLGFDGVSRDDLNA